MRWPRSSPPRCSRFSTACFPRQMARYHRWRNRSGRCRSAGGFSSWRSLSSRCSVSGCWPAEGPPPGCRLPPSWVGLGSGLAALVGLSLTDHALSVPLSLDVPLPLRSPPLDPGAIALAIAHQSSTALWLSGLLYLAASWRELGSDIARFRRVRWMGGVLLGVSILTGLAGAWPRFSSVEDLLTDRYGQVLAGKGVIVLIILVLGLVAMVLPRRLMPPGPAAPSSPRRPGARRPVSRRGARADGPPRDGRARDPGRRRAGGCRPGRSHRVWDGERHHPLLTQPVARRPDPRRPPHGRTRRDARPRSGAGSRGDVDPFDRRHGERRARGGDRRPPPAAGSVWSALYRNGDASQRGMVASRCDRHPARTASPRGRASGWCCPIPTSPA